MKKKSKKKKSSNFLVIKMTPTLCGFKLKNVNRNLYYPSMEEVK